MSVDNGEPYRMHFVIEGEVLTASIEPYHPEDHETIVSILLNWVKRQEQHDRADA